MNIFVQLFFYNFRHGLTQQHSIDELNSIFGDEAPSRTSSTEVVVHFKTYIVKVVQNQLLFRKPLTLSANWYCKIVMWPIMRLIGIIQYCMNIWLSKKFVRFGSHTICQLGIFSEAIKRFSMINIFVFVLQSWNIKGSPRISLNVVFL